VLYSGLWSVEVLSSLVVDDWWPLLFASSPGFTWSWTVVVVAVVVEVILKPPRLCVDVDFKRIWSRIWYSYRELDLEVTIRLDRWTESAAKHIHLSTARGCHWYSTGFKDTLECLSRSMILNMMR
jgi:hypothetical protein